MHIGTISYIIHPWLMASDHKRYSWRYLDNPIFVLQVTVRYIRLVILLHLWTLTHLHNFNFSLFAIQNNLFYKKKYHCTKNQTIRQN